MQNRSRACNGKPRTRIAAIATLATPLLVSNSPAGVDVTIVVSNIRSTDGKVLACMTAKPENFPDCDDDPAAHSAEIPASESGALRFRDVRPGTYAIALLHDENANGKGDRALALIPREGFGFSRDARLRMGPPAFEDAAFEVGTRPVEQTIRMRYLF